MNSFESSLNQYISHDSIITDVVVNVDAITFVFEKGVFTLNQNDFSSRKTDACNMTLYIENFDCDCLYQNLEIKTVDNGVAIDTKFDDFLKTIKKEGLKIYLDYYSFFAKSVLLIGTSEDFEFEITVTDIKKIVFSFLKP